MDSWSLADMRAEQIADSDGPDTHPVWSPDGKQIAFQTARHEFYYYVNSLIATIPVEGGKPTVRSVVFDEKAKLEWSSNGILCSALQRTSAHLFRFNPINRKIERMNGLASSSHLTAIVKKWLF